MSIPSEPTPIELAESSRPTGADVQRGVPLERVLFALAGTMTLVSVALAVLVSPWFLLLTTFVGINQWLYVTVHACPASLVLTRLGFAPRCHW